jgi:hypothetical protein
MHDGWSLPCTKCRTSAPYFATILTFARFGIELAPEVVQADGNVQNLAWRICNAKKVLVSTSVWQHEHTADHTTGSLQHVAQSRQEYPYDEITCPVSAHASPVNKRLTLFVPYHSHPLFPRSREQHSVPTVAQWVGSYLRRLPFRSVNTKCVFCRRFSVRESLKGLF